MKSTDKPSLIETVIASGANASYVRTIPKTQTKSGSGEMSLDLGWPPECATPIAAGGKYPQMADANGVLNLLSAAVQQLQARFFGPYNADFATAIGGYPLNAIVSDTTAGKFWVSTAEDNTTAPGADGASWQSLFAGYATQAWAEGKFQPAGDYATHSDLSGYLKNANGGIGGEQSGTSLVYQISAERAFFSYNNNRDGGNLAWYSDVVGEVTARTNADNNLQSQISAKMDSSFAASGIIAAGGAAGNGTIAGGTWMRVGNTLTQSFTVENISSGTITFPVAFSGSDDQVTCIFQTGDGSASTFRPGQITTKSARFHSPGGGGASRMTVLAQGPYGT